MAHTQSEGGSRGAKGAADKPKSKPPTNPTPQHAQAADSPKVGSDPSAAREFGGKTDFGAREDDTIERSYVSANTRASDPGAAQPHSVEAAGHGRMAGAGGTDAGPGSSSGGDLDTDFVGVAGGSGLAQAPPSGVPGPDDSDGTVREFASGPPTQNSKGPKAGKVEGTTVDREGDIQTIAEGRGAAAASRPARGDPDFLDDAFVGEVSQDEAQGEDSQ
jgi:hypothetical protein